MSGSTFGKLFRVTTWGESHGPALGAVIDGCPSGFSLDIDLLQQYIDRRKPQKGNFSTARTESDTIHLLSGLYEGKTLGTPISCVFYNEDARSLDYEDLKDIYRPGHADSTYDMKYGHRDHRGGGRSSGRETIARVAAGGIATQILNALGIRIDTYVTSIGTLQLQPNTSIKDAFADDNVCAYLDTIKTQQDSVGGMIECHIHGVFAGLGEPVFDKLDARLSAAVFSIGGIKAVEIGSGIHASHALGSQHNDAIIGKEESGSSCQRIITKTNHAGGILGGISNGMEIVVRASVKPTPSIGYCQQTITKNGTTTSLEIQGRHDTTIVPRVAVVAEAMCALTILDAYMESQTSQFQSLYE